MAAKSIIIQPSNSLPPSQRSIEMDTTFQLVISLMILSTIGLLIHTCIPKSWQRFSSFKLPPKTPCFRCRYFSNNSYLKCAIHPVTTLTEQAVDCRDYCPNSREQKVE
jgi:hypothetical protein